jgi:hypothetical protein
MKNKLFFSLIALCLLSFSTLSVNANHVQSGQFQSIICSFFDDFSDPTSGWAIYDSTNTKYRYYNGEYQIWSNNYYYLIDSTNVPQCDNFRLDVAAKIVEDQRPVSSESAPTYGVFFGLKNGYTPYYKFVIYPDGYFELGKLTYNNPSGITYPVPKTYSENILKGLDHVNNLFVIKVGDTMKIGVNGFILATIQEPGYTPGDIGVVAGPNPYGNIVDARFDNFSLTPLKVFLPAVIK